MRPPPRLFVLVPAMALVAGYWSADGPLQRRDAAFAWHDHVSAGATLRVRNMNGEIEVTPAADDMVRVTASISWRRGDPEDALHLSGTRDGADALSCAVWGKGTCTAEN